MPARPDKIIYSCKKKCSMHFCLGNCAYWIMSAPHKHAHIAKILLEIYWAFMQICTKY